MLNNQNLQMLFNINKIILDGSDSYAIRKYYQSSPGIREETIYITGIMGAADINISSVN